MVEYLRACLVAATLLIGGAALHAQDKGPPPGQPAPEKNEPAAPAAPAEPVKYERDGTTMLVHYFLGGVGTLVVMLLLCMPVRRD